jgi:hypothetical protein
VEDALTVGDAIGASVAANAGLPNEVPEPSGLMICTVGVMILIPLHRGRRRAPVPDHVPAWWTMKRSRQ